MKKIVNYMWVLVLLLVFTQCSLDTDLYQNIDSQDAFNEVQDVQNAMNGAYECFGDYTFYGNYVLATNDMATDISMASASSGHFTEINGWSFDEYNAELLDMWTGGYKILDRCVRGINGGKALLASSTVTESDSISLCSYISQMYSLRAVTSLVLVNLFALPYAAGSDNSNLGILLVTTEPIEPFEQVSRSTVGQTYTQILTDIADAKQYLSKLPDETKSALNQFYFNEAAVYALEARVKLYMHDYDGAKVAAQQAIDLRASGDETLESFVNMWKTTAITKEDIFTIAKSDDDNLSANSLNTLYGSYEASVSSFVLQMLDSTDVRSSLINATGHPMKFDGTATSADVSNIPVFRKSEMYLILAECNLLQAAPDITAAKKAVFYTAKRDTAVYKTVADLPATHADLVTLVAKERVREFFQEGHRFFDLRRTGALATIAGVSNFDLSKFVYPIPGKEVDTGYGIVQNTDWSLQLP
jgi:starch-binding outer membrane protein, SusD/RagB family